MRNLAIISPLLAFFVAARFVDTDNAIIGSLILIALLIGAFYAMYKIALFVNK